jgi:hypothetical protein
VAASACALLAALAVVRLGDASDPWAKLHRPLHLPRLAAGAVCPVSGVDQRLNWKRINIFGGSGIGRGPVYPGLGGSGGTAYAQPDGQYGGLWTSGKVFWYVRPSYLGRVLIRGHRLDGPQLLGFNGGRLPARELRIEPWDSVSWEGQPTGSRGVPSSVRVLIPGCYGVQIDGTTFSRVVVFSVAEQRSWLCAADTVTRRLVGMLDAFNTGRARAFSRGFTVSGRFEPYNGAPRRYVATRHGAIESIVRARHQAGDRWTMFRVVPPADLNTGLGEAIYGLNLHVKRRGIASYDQGAKIVIVCASGRVRIWLGPVWTTP